MIRIAAHLAWTLAVVFAAAVLPAQVPNYNGVWQLTPSLVRSPTFFAPATHMRIVAQPPGITCFFGSQFGWSLPLAGQLTTATSATASLQTGPSQCVWSFVVTLSFVAPNQIAGTLVSTDLYSCFFSGTVTESFTASRVSEAMYEPFADSCPGSPAPPVLGASSPPTLSGGFTVTVGQVPAGAAFLATGVSNTASGAASLPLDLGPAGMTGCSLHVSPDLVVMLTGGPVVQATWVLPSSSALLGATFYQQAWVPGPYANPLGATMSNAMVGVIGP